jgi:cellobiose phosphorylase
MVAGSDAVREGEAKNSWLTGTAAWNYVAIAHHMLGIRPEFTGLRVSPCIGPEVPSFSVTRRCRGAVYRIRVTNSLQHKKPRLTVDGAEIEGTLIPFASPGSTIEVECET